MSEQQVVAAVERALEMGEVGVQVAAHLDGEPLVEVAAGEIEPGGAPVDANTLFAVFSVTKAIVATTLHLQAERGFVDYDAPVARYWPEFAQHGKDAIVVGDVLCHRSGIPQMPDGVTPELMCDWEWMVHEIEGFEPMFPPGTTNAYHELVWGWIIGEIVRRSDPAHRSLRRYLSEELTGPLGIDDLYLGVGPELYGRLAPVLADGPPVASHNEYLNKSMPLSVFPGPAVHNLDAVRSAQLPGAGVLMNARSGSRFFSLLARGGELGGLRLLSEERVRRCTTPRPDAHDVDKVMGWVAWVGVGGYWLGGEAPPAYPVLGRSTGVLAHPGIGGSIGWADLDSRLSVVICHNWMQPDQVQGSTDPSVNPFIAIAEAVRATAGVT